MVVRDAVSGLYERAEQELTNVGVHLMSSYEVTESLAASVDQTVISLSDSRLERAN